MKKKNYTIIFIILVVCFTHTFSWASISSIQGEIGNVTRPVPSGDSSTPSVPGGGSTVEVDPGPVTIPVYTSISGMAFEDYRQYDADEDTSDLSNMAMENTTNNKKDNNEPAVSNVIVQLIDTSGNVCETTYTDMNGNYQFSPPGGTYKLRFIYGMPNNHLSNSDLRNKFQLNGSQIYTDMANIRKYNAQDYFAKIQGQTQELLKSWQTTIIKKEKGCSQLFLMIDCSQSMMQERSETGEIKLQQAKESAKQLVEQLLTENDNIYIGIIGFGEKAVIRKNLSNHKDEVISAIDNIDNLAPTATGEMPSYGSGTNMVEALQLAKDSFVNQEIDKSNRSVIMISDGVATMDGINRLYADDSVEQIKETCRRVASNTNQTLRQLDENGITVFPAILEPDSSDPENAIDFELIHTILDGVENYYTSERMEEIGNYIKEQVKEQIETNQYENTELYEPARDIESNDNADRRKEVIAHYQNIHYQMVDQHVNQNVLTEEFINNNYMYAETGYEYSITNPVPPNTEDVIYVPVAYSNQNLILTLREPAQLQLEDMKITGMRIILSDGTIFKENIDDTVRPTAGQFFNNEATASSEVKGIADINGSMGSDLIQTLDEEIMHGATIQLEYTIKVKNTATAAFTGFSLIDYIPNGLSMNPDTRLLTEDSTNADYGWQNMDREMLVLNYIDPAQADQLQNTTYPVAIIGTNTTAIDNAIIGTNGSRYIKVVLQAIINAGADNLNYENEVEILTYSNDHGRMMGEYNMEDYSVDGVLHSMIRTCRYMMPGNMSGLEFDHNNTARVIIIPPTGEDKKYHTFQLLVGFMIVALIILIVKKKRSKKRVP